MRRIGRAAWWATRSGPAERALLELLDRQASLDGFEELARHALAVRAAEARDKRTLRFLGKTLWGDAFGTALSRAVGESDAAAPSGVLRGNDAMDLVKRKIAEAEAEEAALAVGDEP